MAAKPVSQTSAAAHGNSKKPAGSRSGKLDDILCY
jgi:hypothetical protein